MTSLRVAFRADASLDIGTGHVMRCLTLADALRGRGADCFFLSRLHAGHMVDAVRERGYAVHVLPEGGPAPIGSAGGTAHAGWLGVDMGTDASQTLAALAGPAPDWLVVDHYALDARWEVRVRTACRRLLVLDDLADRPHACDMLVDQTLHRRAQEYAALTEPGTLLFVGQAYCLLRPDFARLRPASLARRATAPVRHLLVTMGGVDKHNATGRTLDALRQAALPADLRITVVMGASAPWLRQVREQAALMPWPTEVRVHVADMAALMAAADIAIGAAGTTAWERCCLGLPTLTWVLADNQLAGAAALQAAGCVELLPLAPELPGDLLSGLHRMREPGRMRAMQEACAGVTDGGGTGRVADIMLERR